MKPYDQDPGKNAETPNILLISCDHLRMDWLRCNGHRFMQTPQIDQLANEGVNFQAAFSSCPMCVPARRIMMTGQGRHAIGMNENHVNLPFTQGPKLAEVMTRAGYQTFASGKLHTWPQRNRIGFEDVQLNEEGRTQDGTLKDDYEMFLADQGYAHRAYTHGLGNNQYGYRPSPLPEHLTATHWTAQKAMEFLDRRDPTRPFFLFASFDKPHPPMCPPPEYYDLYRDVVFDAPPMGEWTAEKTPARFKQLQAWQNYDDFKDNPEQMQQIFRAYAAMVTHIDSMIGTLLGSLQELRLRQNTHVIFTSDHGDHLFDHGNFGKSDFFRGSCGIPFIVSPARTWSKTHDFKPGQIDTDHAVGLIDLMPTMLDLCGVDIPDAVEGQSAAPILLDAQAPFRSHICGDGIGAFAVSDGRSKYLWYSEDNIEFLFDVRNDPEECHDLSEDPAWQATLSEGRQRLITWLETNNNPHVKDGELVPVADFDPNIESYRTSSIWNNRGRH